VKQSIAALGLSHETLKAPFWPSMPLLIDIVKMCHKGCSIYSRLLNIKPVNDSALVKREERWHSELNCTFGVEYWRGVYLLVSKMRDDNRLKWFQFQINRNSLFTNYKVNKSKPFISPMCSFCGDYPELISHLFNKCKFVLDFWSELRALLDIFNLVLPTNIAQILFGSQDMSPKTNYLLICGKYFIWKARLTDKVLTLTKFMKFLHSKLEAKRDTFICSETMHKISEWNDIYKYFSRLQCPTALAPMPTNVDSLEGALPQ